MHVRVYDEKENYYLLASWWVRRGNPVPERELMAPTGRIVYYNDKPICAGFLFKTDAKIAVISHVVSNPDPMDKNVRGEALDLLIAHLIKEAHLGGFKMVSASSNLDRLNKRYEKLGFVKTDSGEVHYGRAL